MEGLGGAAPNFVWQPKILILTIGEALAIGLPALG
jgi:hypothetical protein